MLLGFCPSGSGADLRFKSGPNIVNKIRLLGNSKERKFEFAGDFGFPTQINLRIRSRDQEKSQHLFGLSRKTRSEVLEGCRGGQGRGIWWVVEGRGHKRSKRKKRFFNIFDNQQKLFRTTARRVRGW